jgi:hypothetical protein
MLSVGTGSLAMTYAPGEMTRINRIGGALRVLEGLLAAINEQQDIMCRAIGRCLHGPPLDSELGDLIPLQAHSCPDKSFLYCRYNYTFTNDDLHRARAEFRSHNPLALDDLRSVPLLSELGASYASTEVRQEHLPEAPLLAKRFEKF